MGGEYLALSYSFRNRPQCHDHQHDDTDEMHGGDQSARGIPSQTAQEAECGDDQRREQQQGKHQCVTHVVILSAP